ncbi:MAG: CobW family GTP-binding protein [Nitrospirota bacterium]
MSRLVPIDIVTGFLGSGKTTLLQHVLQNGLEGQRVAVIVNDLAEYNIDGRILKGMNIDRMVQLTSGCLCCSGTYPMGLALQEIIETSDPALILIETSGAAAPGPVVAELSQMGYRTDAVITVVDAEKFLDRLETESVVADQVAEADFLVLNKLDLTDSERITVTKRRLGKLNRRALLIESRFGRVPADLLFATGIGRLRRPSKKNHAHPDDLDHFAYDTDVPLDRRRLERLLNRLPGNFYRAKGFLNFANEPHPRLLNYTTGRYTMEPFRMPVASPSGPQPTSGKTFRTQLVFVGRGVTAHRWSVTDDLDRCAAGSSRPSLLHRPLAR